MDEMLEAILFDIMDERLLTLGPIEFGQWLIVRLWYTHEIRRLQFMSIHVNEYV